MAQSLTTKIKGLFTSVNELSEVPEGALLKADNIDILKDSIAEPRRGFEPVGDGFVDGDHRAARLFFFQDKPFAHHGDLGAADKLSYQDNAGEWQEVGSFAAPAGARMRVVKSNQNLYLTTASGVIKLDAFDGTAGFAGGFKGLDVEAAESTDAAVWLPDDFAVAYRVLWGIKDANGNVVRGSPSQREVFTNNGGGPKAVDVTATIPVGVTEAWFFQIYRSAAVDNSGGAAEPSDELGMVYEGNPTNTDITNGYVTVADIVPDALRGATIYTAASQEGLANQNEAPPLAKDMAIFRDSVFFANVRSKQRAFLTLLSTGGTNGLQVADTVTIDNVAFTGAAAEDIAAAEFKVFTGGSAAQDIRNTALSLIRVINRHASSTVYAYYVSGLDDLPGKLLLEERTIGGAPFEIESTRSTCWNPSLTTTGTDNLSSNDEQANGLAWSKPNQPEAVPLVNYQPVGDKDAAILRIIPLKDALFIFKEDGIYRLTGYYPTFSIELFDSSAILLAPESAVVLNNQIFCLTDQGVTVVSDGVKVISRPIEQDLLRLIGASVDNVKNLSWGVGYETERKYYLFTYTDVGDATATQAYVFNIFTNTWVRHIISSTTGVVDSNRLYMGDVRTSRLLRDRKRFDFLDYADYIDTVTISDISDDWITISGGADLLVVGDALYQNAQAFAIVSEVDLIGSRVRVLADPGLTAAPVDLLKAIACDIQWAPITTGNPGIQKHYHTVILLFKTDFQGTGMLTFSSDLSLNEESVPLVGSERGAWGLFPWGEAPWGGEPVKRPARQWIPAAKQRSSQLTVSFQHTYAFSAWQLQGLSLFGTPGSERVRR